MQRMLTLMCTIPSAEMGDTHINGVQLAERPYGLSRDPSASDYLWGLLHRLCEQLYNEASS